MKSNRLPHHIHFVGIGGAGMAPLAEIMLTRGASVSGTDRESTGKTAQLAALGATVHVGHDAEFLPENLPRVVVHAPVCRPAWLVEMECLAINANALN